MKYRKNIGIVILFLILVFSVSMNAYAMNTGFSTEKLSKDEENTFLSNIDISMFYSEPSERTISCFDVNEDGMIAIGSDNSGSLHKTISIYDSEGCFQYGYEFTSNGSFGVEWDNSDILIYFVRSDVALAIDAEGKVEEISKIQDSYEINTYWQENVFATKRNIGDIEYEIKNDMGFFNIFASSYSQMISKTDSGTISIIYDANEPSLSHSVGMFAVVIIIVVIAVGWVVIEIYRHK